MHAARAVNARAQIIWGGVTLPSFAGYPDAHQIIMHTVACAPCGLRGNCPNGKICMNNITANDVYHACRSALNEYMPGITTVP